MFHSLLTDIKVLSILINWNRFVKWDCPLSCSMTVVECCQVCVCPALDGILVFWYPSTRRNPTRGNSIFLSSIFRNSLIERIFSIVMQPKRIKYHKNGIPCPRRTCRVVEVKNCYYYNFSSYLSSHYYLFGSRLCRGVILDILLDVVEVSNTSNASNASNCTWK